MALPKGEILTGARARFTVGTKVVGFATNVTVTESIQYEAVNVLDNIEVQEHVPVGYDVSMTASRVRLINRSLKSPVMNIFPKTGIDPQEHLANIIGFDLPANSLDASIEDTVTQTTYMLMEQVKIQSHNFTVTARGIVGEDVTFVGIRVKDETEA